MKYQSVRKIGNSLGVILPKWVLDRTGLRRGDELEVTIVHVEDVHGILLRVPPTSFKA